jgi:hypothetical protein
MTRTQKVVVVFGFALFVGSLWFMPYEWRAHEAPDVHHLSVTEAHNGVIRRPFFAPPNAFEVHRTYESPYARSFFAVDTIRVAPERMLIPWLLILGATVVGIIVCAPSRLPP